MGRLSRRRPQVDETVERTSDQSGPPGWRRTGLPERLTSLRKPFGRVGAGGQRHVRTASAAAYTPSRLPRKAENRGGPNFFLSPGGMPGNGPEGFVGSGSFDPRGRRFAGSLPVRREATRCSDPRGGHRSASGCGLPGPGAMQQAGARAAPAPPSVIAGRARRPLRLRAAFRPPAASPSRSRSPPAAAPAGSVPAATAAAARRPWPPYRPSAPADRARST